MQAALKFVQGAVSRKDYVPELTHFRIQAGRITGYNGKLSISSPIDLDIDCCPKAAPFVRAIETCTDTVQLHLTRARKLAIRSAGFSTHIETIPEAFVGVEPEGVLITANGALLPALRTLERFCGQDASRPWATGILLDGYSAYATNNVTLCEHWLGFHFPYRATVPGYAVREVLRVGEEPAQLMLSSHSMTFMYGDGRWIRTQLHGDDWPDLRKLLDNMPPVTETEPLPEGLYTAAAMVEPFVDEYGHLYFLDARVATVPDDAEQGTSAAVPGLAAGPVFNVRQLRLLEGAADSLGLASYPRPCPFYGPGLRGLIAGMRA